MKTASEIRAGVGVLIGVQMVVAFASIGLLTRMSPAIERVLVEDVATLTAVEEMTAVIARMDCGLPTAEAEFQDALDRARMYARTPKEDALIADITAKWRDSLAGEIDDKRARVTVGCEARDVVIDRAERLADLARTDMITADIQNKRLGAAGAWATVILGLLTFGISAATVRRFTQRIAGPLAEVEAVLLATSRGDPYRRCRRLDAPTEYGVIAVRLNQFLDRRLAKDETEDPQLRALDRALLQHLLDRMPDAVVAVDRSGAVVAASDRAMDVIAGSGVNSLADALKISPEGDPEISLIQRVEPFGKQQGFLVWLKPLEGVPAADDAPSAPILGEVVLRRHTISEGLADRGAADDAKAHVVKPEPRTDKKKDWERD